MSVLHEALHMYDALNVLSGIVMTPGGSKVGPESITYAMEAIFETLDNIDRFENYLTSGKFIDCNDVIETWKTHTGKLTVTTQHYMIQGGGYTRFETQFKYVISDTNTGRIEAWAFKKLKDEFGLKIDCAALVKHLQPLIDKQFECCKIDCSHVSKEFGGSKE